MQTKPLIILGINPGSKYIGYSLFYGTELRDWGIKVVKGKMTVEKQKKMVAALSDLVDRHQPIAISIKRLNPSRSSPGIYKLVAKIETLAQKKTLKIFRYGIKEMERFFLPEGNTSKKKMAETIASDYPALMQTLTLEKGNRNAYHIRMFEAVALSAICFHQLDNQ